MRYIANARMYSVAPPAKAAWNELLAWVLQRAGLDWDVIDHAGTLDALWSRNDLGCVMMCGLPLSMRNPQPRVIAAPIPAPARFDGRPIYWSDILVRADAQYQTLSDTLGGTVGYTVENSQSGCVGLRQALHPLRRTDAPRLYAKVVGPLGGGRALVEALAGGAIDVGAVDSYLHEILRLHEPELAAQVRLLTTTERLPIPPLIAAPEVADADVMALRAAFMAVGEVDGLAPLRAKLLLRGFAVPDVADYDVLKVKFPLAAEYAGIW